MFVSVCLYLFKTHTHIYIEIYIYVFVTLVRQETFKIRIKQNKNQKTKPQFINLLNKYWWWYYILIKKNTVFNLLLLLKLGITLHIFPYIQKWKNKNQCKSELWCIMFRIKSNKVDKKKTENKSKQKIKLYLINYL